jgi:hypothetical protein
MRFPLMSEFFVAKIISLKVAFGATFQDLFRFSLGHLKSNSSRHFAGFNYWSKVTRNSWKALLDMSRLTLNALALLNIKVAISLT